MQTRHISMYPLHPPDQLFSKVVEQVSSCYPDICCVSAPRELSTPIPRLWAGRAIKMAPVEPKWHQVEMPSTTSGAMSKGQLRNVFIDKTLIDVSPQPTRSIIFKVGRASQFLLPRHILCLSTQGTVYTHFDLLINTTKKADLAHLHLMMRLRWYWGPG